MPVVIVAALGAIAEAILALILLGALWLLGYFVSRFGDNIPVVGGYLSRAAQSAINAAVSAINNTLQGSVSALTWLFNAIALAPQYILSMVLTSFVSLISYSDYLKYNLVPAVLAAARSYALSLYAQARSYALSLYNQAIHYADHVGTVATAYALSLYNRVIAYADHVYVVAAAYALSLANQAIHYADHVGTLVTAYAASLYNKAIAYADHVYVVAAAYALSLYTKAIAYVDASVRAAIDTARALASAALADAIRAMNTAASVALARVWPGVITDVEGIVEAIPEELTDIRDELLSIPRVAPVDLAGAIAGLGAISLPLLRYLKDCGVPQCKNLHGLSDLMGELLGDAVDVALLALLIEAARDPRGAADDIHDVVTPVVNGSANVLRELIGL